MRMDVSIIILNWNSRRYIDGCLGSILNAFPGGMTYEIIVIDNGSSDGSVGHIKSNYPDVILIENDRNRGVAPARNQGIEIAKGKYILMLDVDVIMHEGSVAAMIGAMDRYEDVGMCGPKLIGNDGRLQYSCRYFPTILSKVYRQLPDGLQKRLLNKEELRDWGHNSPRFVGYVIGACQMMRRQALKDVGIYDASMFYGCEEVDLCMRFWKKGWKVLYDPSSVVTHIEQRLGRKRLLSRLQMAHNSSIILYFWKHRYVLRHPSIRELEVKGGGIL